MSKKKVLIVTSHFHPNVGGVETFLKDQVRVLSKNGWFPIVATYVPLANNYKAKLVEKNQNVIIYRMPWIRGNLVHKLTPYPPLELIYLFPGLFLVTGFALLANPKIKVIHTQGLVPATVGLFWAKLLRKRVIMSTHNMYFFPKTGAYKQFSLFVLGRMDMVLSQSVRSKNEMLKLGVNKNKIALYNYFLNLSYFKPGKKKRKKVLTVLFVGRLIKTKGVMVLLETASFKDDVDFVFVGLGPLEKEIKSFQTNHSNIDYKGPLKEKDVRKQMVEADVLVAPSLVAEGFPRVAMEALATGLPVIASNKGGLSEVVDSSVGWLLNPNVKEISRLLSTLVKDRKKLTHKARAARKYAEEKFSDQNIGMITKFYEKEP